MVRFHPLVRYNSKSRVSSKRFSALAVDTLPLDCGGGGGSGAILRDEGVTPLFDVNDGGGGEGGGEDDRYSSSPSPSAISSSLLL